MQLSSGKVQSIVSLHLSLYFTFPIDIFQEIPKLPAVIQEEIPDEPVFEDEEDEPLGKPSDVKRNLKTSGPKVLDPYADDQSSSFLPLLIAFAAILPVIFCLCRL